jgi:hypothetical protein
MINIPLRRKYTEHKVDGGGKPKRAKGGKATKADTNPSNNPSSAKRHSIQWYLNRTLKAKGTRL